MTYLPKSEVKFDRDLSAKWSQIWQPSQPSPHKRHKLKLNSAHRNYCLTTAYTKVLVPRAFSFTAIPDIIGPGNQNFTKFVWRNMRKIGNYNGQSNIGTRIPQFFISQLTFSDGQVRNLLEEMGTYFKGHLAILDNVSSTGSY